MDYETHCGLLEREGARVAELAGRISIDAPVPTCPGWTVSDLLAHVGFVHRRSTFWVSVRASERLSVRGMNLSRGPLSSQWMAEGTSELLDALRSGDPDEPMWAWGADQHVRFWARRMLHETLVHRIDLEETCGERTPIDPAAGEDAIDEFFSNVAYSADFSASAKNLVGEGETIEFSCGSVASWTVQLSPQGFAFVEPDLTPEVSVTGTPADLLVLVYGRRRLEETSCEVVGRRDLLERWITHSALI